MNIEWRFDSFEAGHSIDVIGTVPGSGASLACRVRVDSVNDKAKACQIGMQRVAEKLGALADG